ncbi:MAG: TIGR00288 family NYN domain-containing protein [Methanocellales archaeon]
MPKETVESLKNRLETFRAKLVPKKEKARKIGLLVDGPNMLRKEFAIDLEEIREILKEYGSIKVGKVFLNQYASEKLVEAIENQGFEAVISSGDVDVRLAVEAMELIFNPNIDTIALVTRDADFKPILSKAMQHGKETIIFGAEPGFSIALKNSADYVIVLNEEKQLPLPTLVHDGELIQSIKR